jgi:hypothetical protein
MVERLICNQQVAGSTPIASSREDNFQSGEVPERPKGADCKSAGAAFGGSNPPLSTIFPREAGIAQWPERQPSKLRVAGSSPVSRSIFRAHVAQLVEHILGKDEVHRFDPGRGLHILIHGPEACVTTPGTCSRRAAAIKAEELPRGPEAFRGNLFLEKRDGQEEV